MFSTLVSAHGFKNEVYSCLARLFPLMDLRTRYTHVFSALASGRNSLWAKPAATWLNEIQWERLVSNAYSHTV